MSSQKPPGSPSSSGDLEPILPSSPPWWPTQEFKTLKQFQLLTLWVELEPSGRSKNRAQSLGVETLGKGGAVVP